MSTHWTISYGLTWLVWSHSSPLNISENSAGIFIKTYVEGSFLQRLDLNVMCSYGRGLMIDIWNVTCLLKKLTCATWLANIFECTVQWLKSWSRPKHGSSGLGKMLAMGHPSQSGWIEDSRSLPPNKGPDWLQDSHITTGHNTAYS